MRRKLSELLKIFFLLYLLLIANNNSKFILVMFISTYIILVNPSYLILLLGTVLKLDPFIVAISYGFIFFNYLISRYYLKRKLMSLIFIIFECLISFVVIYFYYSFDYKIVLLILMLLGIDIVLLSLLSPLDTLTLFDTKYSKYLLISLGLYIGFMANLSHILFISIASVFILKNKNNKLYGLIYIFLISSILYIKGDVSDTSIFLITSLLILIIDNPVFLFMYYFLYKNIKFEPVHLLFYLETTIFIIHNFLKEKSVNITTNNSYLNSFKVYIDKTQELYSLQKSYLKSLDKEIDYAINTYCNTCKKRETCESTKGFQYFFIRQSINQGTINTIDCPNYKYFYGKKLRMEVMENNTLELLNYLLTNLNIKVKPVDYSNYINFLESHDISVIEYEPLNKENQINLIIKVPLEIDAINSYLLKISEGFFQKKLLFNASQTPDYNIVSINEYPNLKLSYYHVITPKTNYLVSGDNYYVLKKPCGDYVFALSDGMGSGINANNTSAEILSLCALLSKQDLSTLVVVKLIESYYNQLGSFDNYATLDYLEINSVKRKAYLYKMGSTATYYYSKGVVKIFNNTNLPLSISDLKDCYQFYLQKHDIILLISDGITETLDSIIIEDILLQNFYKSPTEITNEII